jgi:uncharacterized Zn-finger protein
MNTDASPPPAAGPGAKGAVELSAAELLGGATTFCPNPRMALWSNHPKVFIGLGASGQGRCPYCGTVYRLKDGEHLHGH